MEGLTVGELARQIGGAQGGGRVLQRACVSVWLCACVFVFVCVCVCVLCVLFVRLAQWEAKKRPIISPPPPPPILTRTHMEPAKVSLKGDCLRRDGCSGSMLRSMSQDQRSQNN